MGGSSRRLRLCSGVALSALFLVVGANGTAKAETTDAQIKALQAQVDVLMRTVKELKEAQAHTAADAKAAKKQASQADANSAQAKATAADAHAKSTKVPVKAGWAGCGSDGHYFLERKPGKDLTFYTCGGEITAYGQFDVSLDAATKDAKARPGGPGRQYAGRKFRLDARHLDQHLLSGRARLPTYPRSILQFRLPVRSWHRHFGGGRARNNPTAT